jgi:phosphoribosylformylglycinamidine (FGAM) synthase PurS component
MSKVCFEAGSGPSQTVKLEDLEISDLDGTACYSEGDLIRDRYGRVLDPQSPEVQSLMKKWGIQDLRDVNLTHASSLMANFHRAESAAAGGDLAEVEKILKANRVIQKYSGMPYPEEMAKELLQWAKGCQKEKEVKAVTGMIEALSVILLPSAGFGIFPLAGMLTFLWGPLLDPSIVSRGKWPGGEG